MSNPFFERPIVNSPYEYPRQHWELDASGQPTGNLIDRRRRAEFITPIPKRPLYKEWRDPGEDPKLHLFGQLKRITRQWLDTCLTCKGGTYPALLLYDDLADMACNRFTAGITMALQGTRPIKALLDPYNPSGSTRARDRLSISAVGPGI